MMPLVKANEPCWSRSARNSPTCQARTRGSGGEGGAGAAAPASAGGIATGGANAVSLAAARSPPAAAVPKLHPSAASVASIRNDMTDSFPRAVSR